MAGGTFKCVSLAVTPVKGSYATDEEIELRIQYEVQRKYGGSWDTTTLWASDLYLSDGRLIDSIEHGRLVGQTLNTSTPIDKVWKIGVVKTPRPYTDAVIVKAHDVLW